MMHSNQQYFSFVARFVDAVVTEPLSHEILRSRRQRALVEAAFNAELANDSAPVPTPAQAA